MKINPFYIAARLCRKILPEKVAHKLLSRRSHSVERLYYGGGNKSNACSYLKAIQKTDAKEIFNNPGEIVALEAGSGLYNPISAPLMLAGVTQLLLLEPYIGTAFDEEKFQTRFREFLETAQADKDFPLPRTRSVEDIMPGTSGSIPSVKFLPNFWESTSLPDSSVDLILSASVLEHLRNPNDVMKESARILRPGGYMVNLIDMRDHFFRYPVEMLKYSAWAWNLLTTRTGGSGYQNRLRASQWISILEDCGFSNTVIPNITMGSDDLGKVQRGFDKQFKSMAKDDLQTLHATIVSRKVP